MAYDLIIYTQRARLPGHEALRDALAVAQPPVELLATQDLRVSRGFVPVRVAGNETGFEIRLSTIETDEIADYEADLESSGEQDDGFLRTLRESDTRLTLTAKTDDEKVAAELVATVLARLSKGLLADPQTGIDVWPT